MVHGHASKSTEKPLLSMGFWCNNRASVAFGSNTKTIERYGSPRSSQCFATFVQLLLHPVLGDVGSTERIGTRDGPSPTIDLLTGLDNSNVVAHDRAMLGIMKNVFPGDAVRRHWMTLDVLHCPFASQESQRRSPAHMLRFGASVQRRYGRRCASFPYQ